MFSLLYVDDEEGLLDLGRIYLEREGDFSVITHGSVQNGLAHLASHPVDLIISDYQMPDIDGLAFLKIVREKYPDTPFILFTGRGREEVVIEAINNGADFYLQKGGDPKAQFAELKHKIRTAIERRSAINALRESEQRLSDIIDFLPDATFAIDNGGHIIAWNKAIEEMTGVLASEMLGKGDHEYALPFYGVRRPGLVELIFKTPKEIDEFKYALITQKGGVLIAETSETRPRGKPSTVVAKASPLYDKNGNIAGAIESIRDITESKKAESELLAAYEKNKGLMDSANDAIFIADIETGMLIDANNKAQQMIGRTRSEIQKMHMVELHPERDKETYSRYFEEHASQGSGVQEEIIVDRSGHEITVIVSATRLEFGGRPCLMGIFHDVTDMKNAQDALRFANKKLNMLAEVTRHDIRNKLTVLGGYLELLRDPPPAMQYSMYLSKLKQTLLTISENIEFTQVYENLGITPPVWQNVHDLFFATCAQLDIKKIRVQSDLNGLEIYADPLLERVFFDLVENTLLYGAGVSVIRLSSNEMPDGIVISIEDNGIGIPPPDKERIFTKGFGKSTGFGLFLAQEILSITGITIQETGEYHHGARFDFSVPRGKYRFSPRAQTDRCHIFAKDPVSPLSLREKIYSGLQNKKP
jgi:PAS domain S-box-containing protein